MNKEELSRFIWFLYSTLASEHGIKLSAVPYDTISQNDKELMEDIAEHILLRQLEERRNSLATGLANLTFNELIARTEEKIRIKDAHNELLQRGSIRTSDGLKLSATRTGRVRKK